MKYRLGLDLGTASVGIAAYELESDGTPQKLVYSKVRVFQEPLLVSKKGGVGATKKSGKRLVRQHQRQLDRRSRRYRKLAHLAPLLNIESALLAPDQGQQIHALRANAANNKIPLPELFRVFLKLSKRRGYSGGFKVKSEQDKGVVESGIYKLESQMADTGAKTIGQYLHHRFKKGLSLKLKRDGIYLSREIAEQEFHHIWETQAVPHDILNGEHQGVPLKAIFFNAIFFQRPLKSPAAMVGSCPLEPTLPRAPRAQMASQAFRIEKQISDLRWGHGHRSLPLEESEKEVIRELLNGSAEVAFSKIYTALGKSAHCPNRENLKLNLEYEGREKLKGNTTMAAFAARKLNLKTEWLELDEKVQIQLINFLADLGSPDQVDQREWETSFKTSNGTSRRFHPEMVRFINRMVDSENFDRLSKMGFEGGRQAYSIKASKLLLEKMRNGVDEYDAIESLYGHAEAPDRQGKLQPVGASGNVVVDVALESIRFSDGGVSERRPNAEYV